MEDSQNHDDKPALLKAVEIILANPEDIKKEVRVLEKKYHDKYQNKVSIDQVSHTIRGCVD